MTRPARAVIRSQADGDRKIPRFWMLTRFSAKNEEILRASTGRGNRNLGNPVPPHYRRSWVVCVPKTLESYISDTKTYHKRLIISTKTCYITQHQCMLRRFKTKIINTIKCKCHLTCAYRSTNVHRDPTLNCLWDVGLKLVIYSFSQNRNINITHAKINLQFH